MKLPGSIFIDYSKEINRRRLVQARREARRNTIALTGLMVSLLPLFLAIGVFLAAVPAWVQLICLALFIWGFWGLCHLLFKP